MTADKNKVQKMTYWMKNESWWKYNKNGKAEILPTAPKEAQESYQFYMEIQRKNDEAFERMANIPPDEIDDNE